MKKLLFATAACLAFGLASAQEDPTKTKVDTSAALQQTGPEKHEKVRCGQNQRPQQDHAEGKTGQGHYNDRPAQKPLKPDYTQPTIVIEKACLLKKQAFSFSWQLRGFGRYRIGVGHIFGTLPFFPFIILGIAVFAGDVRKCAEQDYKHQFDFQGFHFVWFWLVDAVKFSVAKCDRFTGFKYMFTEFPQKNSRSHNLREFITLNG